MLSGPLVGMVSASVYRRREEVDPLWLYPPRTGNVTQGATAGRNLLKRKTTTKATLKTTTKAASVSQQGDIGIDADGNYWWLAGYWQTLKSPNGRYEATFQWDGNLVIRDTRKPGSPAKWRSNTEMRLADGRSQQYQKQGHKMILYTPVSH